MRKDLLASLLAVSAATPLGAYANVSLGSYVGPGQNWDVSGLAAETTSLKTTDLLTQVFESKVASFGTMSVAVKELNKGTYKFTVGTAENATITLSGDNIEYEKPVLDDKGNKQYDKNGNLITETVGVVETENAGTYEFTLTGPSVVTISVKSTDGDAGFSFGNIGFEIVFADFGPQQAQYQALLDKISPVAINNEENETEIAEALREQYAELTEHLNGLQKDVNSMEDETLEVYNALGLYNDPTTIASEISDLTNKVKTYNTQANNENTRYANELTYNDMVEALKVAVAPYEANKKAGQAAIDAIKDNNVKAEIQGYFNDAISVIDAEIDDLQAQLNTIKTNYTQGSSVKDLSTSTDYKNFNSALANLAGDVTSLADLNIDANTVAWNKIYGTTDNIGYLGELKKAYNNNYSYYMGLTGYTFSTAEMEKLTSIYNTAENKIKSTLFFEAADKDSANETIKDDAIKDMNDLQAADKAIVDSYTAAAETISAALKNVRTKYNTTSKAIEFAGVQNQESYKTVLDTVETTLSTYENTVETTAASYDEAGLPTVDQANELENQLNGLLSDPYISNVQTVLQWKAELDAAQTAIKKACTQFDMVSKYADAYTGIANAITKLENQNKAQYEEDPEAVENFTAEEKEYVQKGIDTYSINGVNSATALQTAYTGYKNLLPKYTNLNAYFTANIGYNCSTVTKKATWQEDVNAYDTALTNREDKINDIYDNNTGEQIYTACEELATENIVAVVLNSKGEVVRTVCNNVTIDALESARLTLAHDLANNNMSAVEDLFTTWSDALNAADAADIYGPALASLKAELNSLNVDNNDKTDNTYRERANALQKKVATANATTGSYDTKVNAYNGLAASIQTLWNDMQSFQTKLDNAKANVTNLADLNDLIAKARANIATQSTWLDNNIFSPAKEYYQTESLDDYSKSLNTIESNIATSYSNIALYGDTVVTYKKQIEQINSKVKDLETEAYDNQMAYNEQMATAQQANDAVANLISLIDDGTYDASVIVNVKIDDEVYATIGDIKDLLENTYKNNIVDQNSVVYKAFANGESVKENAAIMKVYQGIIDNVNNVIIPNIADDYTNNVIGTNNKTCDAIWTNGWLAKLNDAFTNGVDTYVEYNTANENVGYLAALNQALEGLDYSQIYKYSELITALKADVTAILDKANNPKTLKVLTDADFADVKTTASNYVNEMTQYATNVKTAANACADSYYNTEYGEASNAVATIKADLKTDGVIADIINEVMATNDAALASAQKTYNTAVKAGNQSTVMDPILSTIASVVTNKTTLYNNTWNVSCTFVSDSIDVVKTKIDGFADKGVNVKAQKAAIAKASDDLAQLKGVVAKYTEAEIVSNMSNITANGITVVVDEETGETDTFSINGILATITKANNEAIAANVQYAADEQQLKIFKKDFNDLKAEYETMAGLVGSLDLTLAQFQNDVQVQEADAQIQTLNTKLENCTDAASNKANYERMFAAAKAQINSCYEAAYDCERANLNGILKDLKLAFSDKRADNPDNENLEGWKDSIDALGIEVANLPSVSTIENFAKAYEGMQDLESRLQTLYTKITGEEVNHNNDANQAALNALNAKYDSVAEAVAEAQTAFESSSVSGYENLAEGLNDINSALEEIKSSYEGAGNMLALLSASYVDQLDGVFNNLAIWQAKYNAAEAKQTLNNTNYERLTTQLDRLQELTDTVTNLIQNVYTSIYAPNYDYYIEQVQAWIDENKETIDAENEKVQLNNNSQLNNVGNILNFLNWAIQAASSDEVYNLYWNAANSVSYVRRTLNNLDSDKVLVDSDNIWDEYWNLSGDLYQLDDTKYALNVEKGTLYEGWKPEVPEGEEEPEVAPLDDRIKVYLQNVEAYISDANNIMEGCNDLLSLIKEAEVILGDINDDKVLTVADYNELIGLILENAKYDPTDKKLVAADVNKNGNINVADITALINAMLGNGPTAAPHRKPIYSSDEYAAIESMGKTNGATCYALNLNNNLQYVNVQFDIVMEEGVEISDITIGDRALSLDLYTRNNDGTMRVVLASSEVAGIEGNNGAIVYINAIGGNFSIENMIVSDARGNEKIINTKHSGTTLIDGIMTDMHKAKEAIYNVGGQLMNRVQRGINIIRNSDGKTEKVYKK